MAETTYRIDVTPQPTEKNNAGEGYKETAHQLGLTHVTDIRPSRLYFIRGNLTAVQAEALTQELLADPVTEEFSVCLVQSAVDTHSKIDITLLPGVTDPAAENLRRTAVSLGYDVHRASTGQSYLVEGQLSEPELHKLAETVLSNPVIQQNAINSPIQPPFFHYSESDGLVETIPLSQASDEELEQISQTRRLSMNLAEMQAIRTYYQAEGREPTDVELEMLAQTWSEHCVHKTFRAIIDYTGPNGKQETINGLLKTYLRAATDQINKPWVHSAFVDNAGIVAFTDEFDLAFKVETHNHPSALEPFGGANTGVGGVIRDVLGVSARPIANTDVLCFGPQNLHPDALPEKVLHPSRVQAGVIDGIEDYGNKMGIPTVNGTIIYDPGYTANPLVYCGCLGILPHGSNPTEAQVGDLIVALGGRTGRDGLRGATFSSMEMDTSTSEIAGTAVQIGHPIMEKQVQEVILQARDEQLYSAITDCGAGGFSSAVGEMTEKLGGRVQLQNIPLKYPGLRPWEIWLSEAQERMVLAVPPANLERLKEICAGQDVEATVLGEFTGDGRLRIYYGEQLVGDLHESFLHDGLPQRRLTAVWQRPERPEMIPPAPPFPPEYALLELLAHPNIRSKEDTIRKYDHEVQGAAAVKPLVGTANHGPSDAAVLVPLDTQLAQANNSQFTIHNSEFTIKGAALSNGLCPQFTDIDPYNMAWAAIDEAVRNAVAVGADPDQLAILDNFCWGNPNLPDRLGTLVRCAQGCYDAAIAYGTPFISGKDSLNNEYTGADGEKHAIPGTLLISALGIVPDVTKTATMDFKAPWQQIYVVGITKPELAGSHYAHFQNMHPSLSRPPSPTDMGLTTFRAVHEAIYQGLVTAVHDCSEGGLAVALAEMALAGSLGAKINLANVPLSRPRMSDVEILFSESLGRFVVTIDSEHIQAFEQLFDEYGVHYGHIGFTAHKDFHIRSQSGERLIDLTYAQLDKAFRGHTANSQPKSVSNNQFSVFSESTTSRFSLPTSRSPKILILHANGTNRDRDAAVACEMAGGTPEIVHINQLVSGARNLLDYGMLVIPGGFSYGDDLGAGVLWAADLRHLIGESLQQFVANGRPVLGICNGFQVLVKSGLLTPQIHNPQSTIHNANRPITLTYNESARFECRWVYLKPNPASPSIFTQGLTTPIYCPVAHGEGRFAVEDKETAAYLRDHNLIALTYTAGDKNTDYPFNPNGSLMNIAGICNEQGNVMGLMPHPEDHIWPWQHPRYHRGERGMLGLPLFINGVKNA